MSAGSLLIKQNRHFLPRCPFLLSKNVVYHANEQLIQQNYLRSDKLYYGLIPTNCWEQLTDYLPPLCLSGGETSEHLLTLLIYRICDWPLRTSAAR